MERSSNARRPRAMQDNVTRAARLGSGAAGATLCNPGSMSLDRGASEWLVAAPEASTKLNQSMDFQRWAWPLALDAWQRRAARRRRKRRRRRDCSLRGDRPEMPLFSEAATGCASLRRHCGRTTAWR
jgi:hypothetical protein